MSEVCNISTKYWLPNKSATKIILHETPDTAPSLQKKHLRDSSGICTHNHLVCKRTLDFDQFD